MTWFPVGKKKRYDSVFAKFTKTFNWAEERPAPIE
jgi:hypothetical protein